MADEIEFAKKYTYSVSVYHDEAGDLGAAELSFGAQQWPSVAFKDLKSYTKANAVGLGRTVKAKANDGTVFSLFNCQLTEFSLHADYVIVGDVEERFKAIEIRFSEVSEWFYRWQRVKGRPGRAIRWVNRADHWNVTVDSGEETFRLYTESMASIKEAGEDCICHEHVEFGLESLGTPFSADDVHRKALDIAALLAILIAYPISVVSAHVVCENGRSYGIYFPSFQRVEREHDDRGFWLRCFISKEMLDDKIQVVAERFFASEFRKVTWARLAGMQRYDSFWEYKALGYVSLLDGYVTERARGRQQPPATLPEKRARNFVEALKRVREPLTESQQEQLLTIANDVFSNKREFSFSENLDFMLESVDANVRKIINLSNADFSQIKFIRNKVAHGADLELASRDFTRIHIVIAKIRLLLTYWAFLDFGLTGADFIQCFTQNHSPLHMEADVDRIHLDRVTNAATFFTVSRAQFERLSQIRGIRANACFVMDVDGSIEYSPEHTEAYAKWIFGPDRKGGRIPVEEIFEVEVSRIESKGHVYIECGDDRLELSCVHIIKPGAQEEMDG
ncbi:TPA: hypothetical protein QDB31_005457 [Burkholderia vietnamiensis]|nr:hypothetical protein [Burkholderia vietnamiensis]